ncbi:MAG: crotonase/enoyl-CoA hydratase family protein [Polyangiaceae bacterium]|jgi:enoyl-CoA hydratase|nr:crotonase/enoyl-CoA hydratase family protein [Polyangiaceae bacterium]
MAVLELEREGSLATVWLANPRRRNAMGPAFFSALPGIVAEVEQDTEIRAVVIAAQGAVFSAGLDLKSEIGTQLQAALDGGLAQAREALYSLIRTLQTGFRALARCSKPTIAAIHGPCIGAGLDLVSACDLRFASEDAVLSMRETRMAIVADLGSLQRLGRIIGHGHLRDLALTGRDVGGREAARIGLVNEVLPDATAVLQRARQAAKQVAANSPLAVRGVKRVLDAVDARAVDEGLEYVALWNAAFLPSEDLMEAISSFVQKRPPAFKGR